MSKGDREGFIVKFVESKGQKTDDAAKAYEVWHYLAQPYYWWWHIYFATALLSLYLLVIMFVSCLLRPFWSCSLKSTWKPWMKMLFYRWTRRTNLCLSSAASPPQPFCTAKRSDSIFDTLKTWSWITRRVSLIFFTLCHLSWSLAAEWWAHWWCCTACSSSIVFPKQRSPSITWPWLTSLFPARAWIKRHGWVYCICSFADCCSI